MPTTPDEGQVTPFAAFLTRHNFGSEHDDATRLFRELVDAVNSHQRTGTLTIKVKVSPMDEDTTLVTTVDVSSTPPKASARSQVSFLKDGNLQSDDPRGTQLPLRLSIDTRDALAVNSSDEHDRADARSGDRVPLRDAR